MVRRRLVPIARISVSIAFALAFSLSFLISASHLFVLLDSTVTLVDFAISIVGCSAAAAVETLIVHARLLPRVSKVFYWKAKFQGKLPPTSSRDDYDSKEVGRARVNSGPSLTKASSGDESRRDK